MIVFIFNCVGVQRVTFCGDVYCFASISLYLIIMFYSVYILHMYVRGCKSLRQAIILFFPIYLQVR